MGEENIVDAASMLSEWCDDSSDGFLDGLDYYEGSRDNEAEPRREQVQHYPDGRIPLLGRSRPAQAADQPDIPVDISSAR